MKGDSKSEIDVFDEKVTNNSVVVLVAPVVVEKAMEVAEVVVAAVTVWW